MKDLGFFLGIFGVIIILALVVGSRDESTTHRGNGERELSEVAPGEPEVITAPHSPSGSSPRPTVTEERELSPEEIEKKVAKIYRELDALRDDLRQAILREPTSPYSTLVRLRNGNVRETDPEREYLVLTAESKNTTGVSISDWYLESYVTDEKADIPRGDRIIEKWRSPITENIVLLPGETAYLVTGDSPINVSFRENMCTGYLAEEGDFRPSLRRQCPRPTDELKRFGTKVDLDDDECYEFIERLSSCTTPEDELYTRREVGSACSVFVESTFDYNNCVRLHRYDPFFDDVGEWHVYLEERTELWRPEREIIRLMDGEDRVIAVLEY